LTDILLKLNK